MHITCKKAKQLLGFCIYICIYLNGEISYTNSVAIPPLPITMIRRAFDNLA